jgi:hypothetical protein
MKLVYSGYLSVAITIYCLFFFIVIPKRLLASEITCYLFHPHVSTDYFNCVVVRLSVHPCINCFRNFRNAINEGGLV